MYIYRVTSCPWYAVPNPYLASHTPKPSSVPQGYVDSYSTLPWLTWKAVTGMQGYPDECYYYTRWLTGLWSTQAKVEGIVLKAACHWGRDCSVMNDPLGEPGCTPLYAALPPTRGSVDHEQMFSVFPFLGIQKEGTGDRHHSPWGGLIYWELEKAVEMDTLLHRGPVKNHGGVCSPGTLER